MKHLKYFPNATAIGSGVKVDLPNVSYLEGKNVLFIPGDQGQETVKVNSDTGEIEIKGPITYEYVDLGLPSGTLWATKNVGAETESDYGLYFAWGETQGYPDASIKQFSSSDYKWEDGSKYNQTDGLTELQAVDDAATVNMGDNWHMPTSAQISEIQDSSLTRYTWTTINGTQGRLFTSKINGNTIFFPGAGSYSSGELRNRDMGFFGWGCYKPTTGRPSNMQFRKEDAPPARMSGYIGMSVRGVITP